jgi:hypothetical protein
MLSEQTDPDRRRRRQTKLELSEYVAATARDAVSKVTFNSVGQKIGTDFSLCQLAREFLKKRFLLRFVRVSR